MARPLVLLLVDIRRGVSEILCAEFLRLEILIYLNRLTTGAYAPPLDSRPGFGVSLAIKDAKHAMDMAQEFGVNLPGLELARGNMEAARDYAGECLDSSAMYGTLRQQSGLEFWNEKSRKGL